MAKLPTPWAAIGFEVTTVEELRAVLAKLDTHDDTNIVAHVRIPETDCPSAVKEKTADSTIGEDEIEHPGWPPF